MSFYGWGVLQWILTVAYCCCIGYGKIENIYQNCKLSKLHTSEKEGEEEEEEVFLMKYKLLKKIDIAIQTCLSFRYIKVFVCKVDFHFSFWYLIFPSPYVFFFLSQVQYLKVLMQLFKLRILRELKTLQVNQSE